MRKWLFDIRLRKKLTQESIAKEVKITRTYYTQIENGDRRPSVEVAKRIAVCLDFDWTIFFDDIQSEVSDDAK